MVVVLFVGDDAYIVPCGVAVVVTRRADVGIRPYIVGSSAWLGGFVVGLRRRGFPLENSLPQSASLTAPSSDGALGNAVS